jgi:hypothetical protein
LLNKDTRRGYIKRKITKDSICILNLALELNNLVVSFFADFYPCPSRFPLDLGCGGT